MSRVDDDRDAARVAARLAEAKRAEESKSKAKAGAMMKTLLPTRDPAASWISWMVSSEMQAPLCLASM
mgnify:CR=1 FL=1